LAAFLARVVSHETKREEVKERILCCVVFDHETKKSFLWHDSSSIALDQNGVVIFSKRRCWQIWCSTSGPVIIKNNQ